MYHAPRSRPTLHAVFRRLAVLLAGLITTAALVGVSEPAQAASYHCQHRVTDGVWSWTVHDSYTTGIWTPVRHPVSMTLYFTGQVCNNRRAPDRLRIKSTTACLTDSRHAGVHTGTTFNPYFHTLETDTKVNPPAYKVVEDGSPEHRCARSAIARSIQKWVPFLSRPVASVVSTHNLTRFPDATTGWRTRTGSTNRRIYQSDVHLLGPSYWSSY